MCEKLSAPSLLPQEFRGLVAARCEHLYKSRSLVRLLVRSIQVCVNTTPRRKDISNDLREATVAAHQSGKGYKAISKLFGVHHSTERKIIHRWKTFKSYISDSTGLS